MTPSAIPIFLKALDDPSIDVRVISLMKIDTWMEKHNAEILKKIKEVLKRDKDVKGGEFGGAYEYPIREICEHIINRFEKKDSTDDRKCPNE